MYIEIKSKITIALNLHNNLEQLNVQSHAFVILFRRLCCELHSLSILAFKMVIIQQTFGCVWFLSALLLRLNTQEIKTSSSIDQVV